MSLFRRTFQILSDLTTQQQQAQQEAEAAAIVSNQVTTSTTPDDTDVTTSTDRDTDTTSFLSRPPGQYTKTRRKVRTLASDPLRPGGIPLQPATQTVPGPKITFSVNDTRAKYKWEGDFGFDNAEYEFTIRATNFFQVRLDGALLIDESNSGPTRSRSKTVSVPAGNHEITIDWRPTGLNSIDFNVAKVFDISWLSCVDGETREGLPPDNWIKTGPGGAGCYFPPQTDNDDAVDLLQVIDISPDAESRIERAYIKGSGTALSPHRLKFLNRSTNMTLGVQLRGPKPIRFITAHMIVGDLGVGGLPADGFELGTRETKEIDVVFITSELESLPEGLIRSDVLIAVSAGTITIAKDSDDNIDIGVPIDDGDIITLPVDPPEPPKPPPPPPTPTWNDCSGTTLVEREGFPPSDWTIRADGCYVPPVPVPPAVSLSVSSTELQTLFGVGGPIGRTQLRPTITAGLSAWNWNWNFDVNRQGAGTGNTSAAEPIASWNMTEDDQRNLELSGKTTRVVEVIATRSGGTSAGQIVRSRHTVRLDNSDLVFIGPPEFDLNDPNSGGPGENDPNSGGPGDGSAGSADGGFGGGITPDPTLFF